jgi:hypothetical protein
MTIEVYSEKCGSTDCDRQTNWINFLDIIGHKRQFPLLIYLAIKDIMVDVSKALAYVYYEPIVFPILIP